MHKKRPHAGSKRGVGWTYLLVLRGGVCILSTAGVQAGSRNRLWKEKAGDRSSE